MNVRFGGHWLAFLWVLNTIQQLQDAVAKMKSAGAVVVELAWQALNQLSAKDTAAALREGGITRAVQCVFYPDDSSMGDPISDDPELVTLAQNHLLQAIAFIGSLKEENIAANTIVGPSCLVLGKKNDLPWRVRKDRIIDFYLGIGRQLTEMKIKVAIELLRPEEDKVIETLEHWIDLIDAVNAKFAQEFGASYINTFGAHYDTHHISERGWGQVETISMLGQRITYVHANGTLRRPAGGEGDLVNWAEVIPALRIVTAGRIVPFINEPFCALVRENCAPLGVGLPDPVEEPGGMILTRETLVANGAVLVNA